MQREAQLLRLLDAVLGSVFSTRVPEGAAAEAEHRQGLVQQVQEAADCAR